jgi:phosphatidylserine/phosphatidylglycerophosphate/cardiolipin synthase-like enzyme
MLSRELVTALTEARRAMSRDAWQRLVAQIGGSQGTPAPVSISDATAGLLNRDAAWILSEAFRKSINATWSEIAIAMTTVEYLISDNERLIEMIWTGPANNRFPVRRIDQVFYDLVAKASRSILLVTFAAYRVDHLCQHLAKAIDGGAKVTLIFESEAESEGQLTKDAAAAFKVLPPAKMRIYYWPLAKRERNPAGRPGKLHVKCAVIDDVALIGSANLTDDAFNRNMELGVLIREPATVSAILRHFEGLIHQGSFAEV